MIGFYLEESRHEGGENDYVAIGWGLSLYPHEVH